MSNSNQIFFLSLPITFGREQRDPCNFVFSIFKNTVPIFIGSLGGEVLWVGFATPLLCDPKSEIRKDSFSGLNNIKAVILKALLGKNWMSAFQKPPNSK